MPGLCRFQPSWLIDSTKDRLWLDSVKGDVHSAYCKLCNKKFDISSRGHNQVTQHAEGKKHKANLKSVENPSQRTLQSSANILKKEAVGVPQDAAVVVEDSHSVNISGASVSVSKAGSKNPSDISKSNVSVVTLTNYVQNSDVTKAEGLWALRKVLTHSSSRSCDTDAILFSKMFPDSAIAAKFQIKKDKISYVITYGLGPYFQNSLTKSVRAEMFFCISFDESWNKIIQKNQMDFHVRYWCGNQVVTRYLTSGFLSSCTASNLMAEFCLKLAEFSLDLSKLLQISCDGPNVNLKFLKDLEDEVKALHKEEKCKIIPMGTCAIHIVHGSYKTGHNKVEWSVNTYLRASFNYFNNFPSRKAEYVRITSSSVFPLKFCQIRWVENSNVLNRALETLPHMRKFIEDQSAKNVIKESSSSNLRSIADLVTDKVLPAKLGFMISVASESEPFLRFFQSDEPLTPFLHTSLHTLLRKLGSRFIQPHILKEAETATKLLNVDLAQDNLLPIDNIVIGYEAGKRLKNVPQNLSQKFRSDCKKYLTIMFKKLLEKSPLKNRFFRGATCFAPSIMKSSLNRSRLDALLNCLMDSNNLTGVQSDKIRDSYLELCEDPLVLDKIKKFLKERIRLDGFWAGLFELREKCDPLLEKCVRMVLCTFHGNAAVEQGFSINKDLLSPNLEEASLIAQRSVVGALQQLSCLKDFEITPELITSIRESSSRRVEALKEKKN